MAFVKRETTAEEAEELRKVAPINPIFRKLKTKFYTQVNDKERNILLVSLGGRGSFSDEREIPQIFLLIWNGNVCCIEAFNSYKKSDADSKDIIWYLKEIYAPFQLKEKNEELIEILKEAVVAYGDGDSDWKIKNIFFNEIAEPEFIGSTGWVYGGF